MTDSAPTERFLTQVERLAHGDRSTTMAIHALISEANASGAASFDHVAMAYRNDHLAALRAAGHDAEREAGRLSLDEVREHLARSVLPRLAGEGLIELPAAGVLGSDAMVRFSAATWSDISSTREDIAAVMRRTGEQPAQDTEPAATEPAESVVPGGSTLEATGLVKMYHRRRVVNDVAIHLRQGEIVGLLGPNGAGKTTTFYMIVGLIQPLSGRIKFDGEDITNVPMYKRARRGIGYLSQEPSIFRKLTVEDNIRSILEMMSLSSADRAKRLDYLLDELGLKHLRHQKAYALSGGERRRLEITRALVTEPKFMMLDEPFAGVDPIAVHDIQTIVSRLRNRNIGVLISDHNVEQTLDIVDRAYIMFDGQVKVSGSVRDLVFDDTVADIYLGPTLTARLRSRFASSVTT